MSGAYYRVVSKRDRLLMDSAEDADQIILTYRDVLRRLTTLLQKLENERAEAALTENVRDAIKEARRAIEMWESIQRGCVEKRYFNTVEN